MNGQLDLLDLIGDDNLKPIKSTDWKWTMADDYPKEKNGLKVFSCFACGGGSTMGYKLAGCDVIGCCEIDPKMNEVYIKNHHPKHNFLMDIRKFNEIPNEELPGELFNLDILDGSPPCTTFSMAGDREESWGKKKKFREGQAEQTLDDLSFVFIDTVAKLRPKVVIMENVEGILLGNAIEYSREIYRKFNSIGYKVIHKLLKGEEMGIPQTRHRVFFIATRLDFDFEKLDLNFNYESITYGEIKSGKERISKGKINSVINQMELGEKFCDTMKRIYGKYSGFSRVVIGVDDIFPTLTAGHADVWLTNGNRPSFADVIHAQTFPNDYDFVGQPIEYVCGMSVPPIMIKRIVTRLIESGIFKEMI
jgi:DNA (cytosine-5)-methyltransferase 1